MTGTVPVTATLASVRRCALTCITCRSIFCGRRFPCGRHGDAKGNGSGLSSTIAPSLSSVRTASEYSPGLILAESCHVPSAATTTLPSTTFAATSFPKASFSEPVAALVPVPSISAVLFTTPLVTAPAVPPATAAGTATISTVVPGVPTPDKLAAPSVPGLHSAIPAPQQKKLHLHFATPCWRLCWRLLLWTERLFRPLSPSGLPAAVPESAVVPAATVSASVSALVFVSPAAWVPAAAACAAAAGVGAAAAAPATCC